MREGQRLAVATGQQMLTQHQVRRAGIGHVLSMFTATGMSESERLETAYMLQRTIIEGFLHGVNVPEIMKWKERIEGKLNVGFTDSALPNRNSIQFGREEWRTKGLPHKLNEFVNRLGARLSARPGASPPPTRSNAVRQFQETPRNGPMRAPRRVMQAHAMAENIKKTVWSSQSVGSVFNSLQGVMRQQGIPMPQVPLQSDAPMTGVPQTSVALQDDQAATDFQTRQEMIAGGMAPMQAMSMPPRSGIASPRTPGQSMAKMAAQMPASGRPNRVILFTGGVTFTAEVNEAARNLEALGIGYDRINSLNGLDYSKYGAIFFAGGNASPEWNAIAGNANELKAAISGGLNYIGNCAGAFLAGDWGGGLGLVPLAIDYPSTMGNNYASTPVTLWDGSTKGLALLGGPGLEAAKNAVNGRELASFKTGEAAMMSFNYGAGHVILSAVHPMNSGGDADGENDDVMQALFKAIVQGQDPDGQVGPIVGGPNIGNNIVNTVNNVPAAPTISSAPVSTGSGGGGGKARRAPNRKTPVAGMLPQGSTNSFAAGIQAIIGRQTPLLNQVAGNIGRGRR